jgi:hypothetical protein
MAIARATTTVRLARLKPAKATVTIVSPTSPAQTSIYNPYPGAELFSECVLFIFLVVKCDPETSSG